MLPSKIHLHKKSGQLELVFGAETHLLDSEFLRVHSPSAEVKGHGPGQEVLMHGKINVAIHALKAVGNYGLLIEFDDGHKTGIYSWNYLLEISRKRDEMWQAYIDRLKQAGKSRDPDVSVIKLQ